VSSIEAEVNNKKPPKDKEEALKAYQEVSESKR
jgi:hypothetical protein